MHHAVLYCNVCRSWKSQESWIDVGHAYPKCVDCGKIKCLTHTPNFPGG